MSRGVGFGVSCRARNLAAAPRGLGVPRVKGVLDGTDYGLADELGRLEARGVTVELDPWGVKSEGRGKVSFVDPSPGEVPVGGRARLEWLLENDARLSGTNYQDVLGEFPGMRARPLSDAGGVASGDMPVAYAEKVRFPWEPAGGRGVADVPPAAVQDPEFDALYRVTDPAERTQDAVRRDESLEGDAARAQARLRQRVEERDSAFDSLNAWRSLPVEERQLRTPLSESEKQWVREAYDREMQAIEQELTSRLDFASPHLVTEMTARYMAEQRVANLPDALVAEAKLARIAPRPAPTPAGRVHRSQAEPVPTGVNARKQREREAFRKRIMDAQQARSDADAQRMLENAQAQDAMSEPGAEPGPAPQQYTDSSPYAGTRPPQTNLSELDTRPRSRYEQHLREQAKMYRMRDPLNARFEDGTSMHDLLFRLQPGDVDSTLGFPAPTRDPLDVETIDRTGTPAGIRPDELRAEVIARYEAKHGTRPKHRGGKWIGEGKDEAESIQRQILTELADPTPPQPRGITAEDWQNNPYLEGQEFLGFNPDDAELIYYNPDAG